MKKALNIVIAGGRGGIGKSTISLTLAKTLDAYLLSNDPTNPLGNVYEDFKYQNPLKVIKSDYNFIYDFAGHLTSEIIDASKECDVFIIIVDNTIHSINGAKLLVDKTKCKNTFIIYNSLGKKKLKYNKNTAHEDYYYLKNSNAFKDVDILPLKYTTLAEYCIDNGDSLLERTLTQKGNINRHYKLENNQIKQIIKRIYNEKFVLKINKA